MKTFNCRQCGAAIERISLKDRLAECDHCGTRHLLPEEKRPVFQGLTFGVISAGDSGSDEFDLGGLKLVSAAIALLVIAVAVYSGIQYKIKSDQQHQALKAEQEREGRRREVSNEMKPVAATVQWNGGDADVLHYETPKVEATTFSLAKTFDKTSGSNNVVVIRVNIDRDGKVVKAEEVSGNIYLTLPSIRAAEATVFLPGKPRVRRITYTFSK